MLKIDLARTVLVLAILTLSGGDCQQFQEIGALLSPLIISSSVNITGNYTTAQFHLEWVNRNDSTDFAYSVPIVDSQSFWAAFGFSQDQKMVSFKLEETIFILISQLLSDRVTMTSMCVAER